MAGGEIVDAFVEVVMLGGELAELVAAFQQLLLHLFEVCRHFRLLVEGVLPENIHSRKLPQAGWAFKVVYAGSHARGLGHPPPVACSTSAVSPRHETPAPYTAPARRYLTPGPPEWPSPPPRQPLQPSPAGAETSPNRSAGRTGRPPAC